MTPEQENRLREHVKVPPVMTLSEVASALRMTVRTLRGSVWLARLGAIKFAGKWLVPADHVSEVLGGNR
jgi:hypothetical protein